MKLIHIDNIFTNTKKYENFKDKIKNIDVVLINQATTWYDDRSYDFVVNQLCYYQNRLFTIVFTGNSLYEYDDNGHPLYDTSIPELTQVISDYCIIPNADLLLESI